MTELNFKASLPLTLGVELEWQILDPKTAKLKGESHQLLNAIKAQNEGIAKQFKPELVQSMIEVNSKVHEAPMALLDELYSLQEALAKVLKQLNLVVAGGGTHPFEHWTERKIYPQQSYVDLHKIYGFLFKQFTVYGQHIHIGCASKEAALYLLHALATYVPHFIALSASSPFYLGVDTYFDCSRLSVVSALPTSGVMPYITDWQEFEKYFSQLAKFKVVNNLRDLYWDIRPSLEYGTIELRICDSPLTLRRAAVLAAYAQAIAAYLLTNRVPLTEESYIPYRYNRFMAMRYGLGAEIIKTDVDEHQPLTEEILVTLEKIKPYADKFGSADLLKDIEIICQNKINDAQLLRQIYQEQKDLTQVSKAAMHYWQNNH